MYAVSPRERKKSLDLIKKIYLNSENHIKTKFINQAIICLCIFEKLKSLNKIPHENIQKEASIDPKNKTQLTKNQKR